MSYLYFFLIFQKYHISKNKKKVLYKLNWFLKTVTSAGLLFIAPSTSRPYSDSCSIYFCFMLTAMSKISINRRAEH